MSLRARGPLPAGAALPRRGRQTATLRRCGARLPYPRRPPELSVPGRPPGSRQQAGEGRDRVRESGQNWWKIGENRGRTGRTGAVGCRRRRAAWSCAADPARAGAGEGLIPSPRCGGAVALAVGLGTDPLRGDSISIPGWGRVSLVSPARVVGTRGPGSSQFPARDRFPLEPGPADRPGGSALPRPPGRPGAGGAGVSGRAADPPGPGFGSPGTGTGWVPSARAGQTLQPGAGFATGRTRWNCPKRAMVRAEATPGICTASRSPSCRVQDGEVDSRFHAAAGSPGVS
ncbi:collagen alpha-1(II) chain-like [Vidua chalybeata]|uniref:collagen alpha-1(II) chain-like n=1 Tax=Vidua chalybeata TaxID=81927 RepID=UPI0023A7C4AC|nr:collagen alpha-1(II) chain-like [Vidua chalybeata]